MAGDPLDDEVRRTGHGKGRETAAPQAVTRVGRWRVTGGEYRDDVLHVKGHCRRLEARVVVTQEKRRRGGGWKAQLQKAAQPEDRATTPVCRGQVDRLSAAAGVSLRGADENSRVVDFVVADEDRAEVDVADVKRDDLRAAEGGVEADREQGDARDDLQAVVHAFLVDAADEAA